MKPIKALSRTSGGSITTKPDPALSPKENLRKVIQELRASVVAASDRSNPEALLQNRARLKTLLEETGIDLRSLLALEQSIDKSFAEKTSDKIRGKDDVALTRELIVLLSNFPNIRANSVQYEEAWPEVEAEYCLKVSLYRMEQATRAAQKETATC